MKKVLSHIFALILCLSLCSCGGDAEEGYVSLDGKGARSDPYKLGDTINFKALYEDWDNGQCTSAPVDVSLKLIKSYYGDEVENLYLENNIYITGLASHQLLYFEVSLAGDYDASIYAENLFFISGLTKDMVEDGVRGTLCDKDLKGITNIYTGVKYNLYRELGLGEEEDYVYATITFKDVVGKEHTIWVDISP